MSTIPSPFDLPQASYTLLGRDSFSYQKKSRTGLSVVILNRGGRPFRDDLFQKVYDLGVAEIISVEWGSRQYEQQSLIQRYSNLKFLLFNKPLSIGEMVNYAVQECSSEYVFVLWNDVEIVPAAISGRVFSHIAEREVLCSVPVFINHEKELLPTVIIPFRDGPHGFKTMNRISEHGCKTLYPFDFVGIYHREKFLNFGGYCSLFTNSYWQKMDFGVRCFLYGESIELNHAIKLNFQDDFPVEDSTRDQDYTLFFLRNFMIRKRRGHFYLPGRYLFAFKRNIPFSGKDAKRLFSGIKKWIDENRKNYKLTGFELLDNWELP